MSEKRDLILTVNIPFCMEKCDFCDKNVYVCDRAVRDAYYEALLREVDSVSDELADYRLRSLFVTGGIPTILTQSELPTLVRTIVKRVERADDFEICVATAPGCIGINVFSKLKDSGPTRMEFALCTTHPFELDALNRSFADGGMALSNQIMEFSKHKNYSIDIGYGLPGQTVSSIISSLDTATKSFEPTSVALYPLRVTEGTPLYRHIVINGGKSIPHVHHRSIPDKETVFELYSAAAEHLEEQGFMPYTAFHFSQPGYEGLHHRLVRTPIERMEIGLGGHSLCGGYELRNTDDLDRYIQAAGDPGATLVQADPIDEDAFADIYYKGGLSMTDGVSLAEGRERYGSVGDPDVWDALVAEGLVEIDDSPAERARLTLRGRCFVDDVLARL